MSPEKEARHHAQTRLQKYLSECGVASRRAAEKLIEDGRVCVNGAPAQIGQSVNPSSDRVTVNGKPVRRPNALVYILLNKPRGTVTSSRDPHGRMTVLDCLVDLDARVFPVGRLDLDVEGALLLTNDGELAYRLTHPKYEVDKVYQAWVAGQVTPETLAQIQKGIALDDGVTAPAKAEILHTTEQTTLVQLSLHEGRKHEVKRLCAAVGHPVRHLQRVAIGNVRLRGLKTGAWRYLADREIEALKRLVGLMQAPRPHASRP